ncbi:hypothetical protein N7449_006239 [Penicillium cf. viridicatum]|uniref:BZIP domain-containing protein n=1 Tax=Penicillium cf. viridicatum TaxID=2972119 RepID=A0A9W9MAY0_9EURO|nr:hypothetical protein N7449_006239 [Penicillium cf. viridicatum]
MDRSSPQSSATPELDTTLIKEPQDVLSFGFDPPKFTSPFPNQGHPEQPAGPERLIPCIFDFKSGSSAEAIKRKRITDLARSRKKTQREKQSTNALQNDTKFLQTLCGFYRSERDYFRNELGHYIPMTQLPPRPPTPRLIASTSSSTTSPPAQFVNHDLLGNLNWE